MIKTDLIKKCASVVNIVGELKSASVELCTDSRVFQAGQMFVALKGESFDGFKFVADLLKKNGTLFVVSSESEKAARDYHLTYKDSVFVIVSDTLLFLQDLSRLHAQDWREKKSNNKVFCISGSNGKTTHKEMLYHYLNGILPGRVIKTEKNNNNHLGVPLTLFQISNTTEFAIVELGSNHPGEIKTLCDIALPDAGLVTNIGSTHLEFFGTEENVFKEEGYLYHSIKDVTSGSGLFLQNMNDHFLKTLPKTKGTITYGENGDAVFKFKKDSIEIQFVGKKFELKNQSIIGKHNFNNLAVTFLVALNYFPQKEKELLKLAESFVPRDNRSMWIDYHGKKVFLDAYNANPSSMRIALEGFIEYCTEHNYAFSDVLFVLGDMNELGNNGNELHREIGEFLKKKGVTQVAFIGRFREFYQKGYNLDSYLYQNAQEFKDGDWKKFQNQHKFFFFKGSRSLQLERILDITGH